MLSAGIATLRRAQRCRALTPPRSTLPVAIVVRPQSTEAVSQDPRDALPRDSSAKIPGSSRDAQSDQLALPREAAEGACEPTCGEKRNEPFDEPRDHGARSVRQGPGNDGFAALLSAVDQVQKAIQTILGEVRNGIHKDQRRNPHLPLGSTQDTPHNLLDMIQRAEATRVDVAGHIGNEISGTSGKAKYKSRQSARGHDNDPLMKVLTGAQRAGEVHLQELRGKVPDGVFERLGFEPREDPFETAQAEAEGASLDWLEAAPCVGPEGASFEDSEIWLSEDKLETAEGARDGLPEACPALPVLPLPEDPEQLKALPRGFEEMTFDEQQEELWIVSAEGRLGLEWELLNPGKHRPYHDDFPPYSPTKVLGMLYRWRNRAWTPQQWRLARAIAGNRSLRFPVLTARAWLRRHAILARRRGVALRFEKYLGGTDEWKSQLDELASQTGITEADIKQWLWILSPPGGDLKIQRFLRSDCRKPIFLLDVLLAKDKKIHEATSIVGLLQYIKENYVLAKRPKDELEHPAYEGHGASMTWWHYLTCLYRLVWHCRESWPAALPLLSRLTADYIGTMRLNSGGALTGYQARSLVLNKALQYFAWPARVRPLDQAELNWVAQRHLLRLAATAEPPLVMDKNSYRSVRSVLIALSKSKAEAKNADRAAKTWPPYRRNLDGMDERRNPEENLSRSAKAGILVREAGYNDEMVDRVLSALGGSTFGQAPTIQLRSLHPRFSSGEQASQNLSFEWASQLRATRNAREGWMMFENPPEPGMRPNVQVYAAMFDKLYARPVTESPAVRPGDAKEIFPVHDGNLSEIEIARLTPPSPEELYNTMLLQDKIRPTGYCLEVLVKNAPSKAAALRYLSDSPYEPYIQALREPVSLENRESMRKLSKITPQIFNAWITMLCNLHARKRRLEKAIDRRLADLKRQHPSTDLAGPATGSTAERPGLQQDEADGVTSQQGSIPEAITLVTAFQRYNGKSANHDSAPWHTIMRALAGTKVLYSRHGAAFNTHKTLSTFLGIYERTTASKGIDPVSFEELCVVIRKTLKLATFAKAGNAMMPRREMGGTAPLEHLLLRAHQLAVKTFRDLTTQIPADLAGDADGDDGLMAALTRYNVSGRPLYRYMMAVACCGDSQEMVRVMDWILDGWDQAYIREEAKSPHSLHYHYMVRTFAYFVGMGSRLVERAEMERLKGRLEDLRWDKGCTWFWPQNSMDDGEETGEHWDLEADRVIVDRWPRLRHMVGLAKGRRPMQEHAPSSISSVPLSA